MRVRSKLFQSLHLDRKSQLLTGRGTQMVRALFDALDARRMQALDDVQVRSATLCRVVFVCCFVVNVRCATPSDAISCRA
jgi:hypothetical protein